jgi:hypothetical protein
MSYSGGLFPGEQLFAVDGDFTSCDPCGLPMVSFPFKGDSILSTRDIVQLQNNGDGTFSYITVPLGTFPNVQPWSANQTCMVLEQEFMVAQSSYIPMRLNTPYYVPWAIGWQGQFLDGQPSVNLDSLILVEEGELQDCGGGISKLRRKFVNLPPTRNEIEQYVYNYPGFSSGRLQTPFPVYSRLQYDYFVFDDYNILGGALFPGGHRLNATTGITPFGFLLQPTFYFADDGASVPNLIFIPIISDTTLPDLTTYQGFISGAGTSNGDTAELVAEGSTLTRWMGNIFERRTRFVSAS